MSRRSVFDEIMRRAHGCEVFTHNPLGPKPTVLTFCATDASCAFSPLASRGICYTVEHMLTHTHHTVRDSSEKLTFIYAPVWYDYKEKLFDNTELT